MGPFLRTNIPLLSFCAFTDWVLANPVEEELETPSTAPNLAVSVSAKFPSSEIFGVKVINGQKTNSIVDFINSEVNPVTVAHIKGELSSLRTLPKGAHPSSRIISNLTISRYDVVIPAGESQSLPFTFTTDLHPQDLHMNLVAVISDQDGVSYQIPAFNGTVTVVDPPTNIFDPQILFLYTLLLAFAGSIIFWIYKIWIKYFLPQTKHGYRSAEYARRSTPNTKSSVPEDQISEKGADGTTVRSGAPTEKTYDESWIPDHHIKKHVARRVKNGGIKKKGNE